MPDVTVDNLTFYEATDGLPADAAADITAEVSTCNINVLQSKSQLVQHHSM